MTPAAPTVAFDAGRLDAVCRRLGLGLVVLYGSRAARGLPPNEDSDLDVAISFATDDPADFWTCYKELADVFTADALDLVLLRDVDPLFRWEIMRESELLWGDPLDHLELRAFAHRDYLDSDDLRDLERRLFRKKMAWIRQRLNAPA